MASKKRDDNRTESKVQREKAISRRDFVAKGAGAAAGASVLSMSGNALAQQSPADAIRWDYEADIVIIGAGCVGLPAAIRARDLGASVIVVDQNFDVGPWAAAIPCSCATSRASATRKASSPLRRCKNRRN
jgi:heterodisulfide reductase subunit A-like polyferredoxin